MCGIAGLLDRRPGNADRADRVLAAMSEEIARRGPDGAASWSDSDPGIWLAHRRLSVIDLSDAGSQPMASHDGRVVMCYNGMLYNAAELRPELEAAGVRFRGHSDTEVLVNALAVWGLEKALPRLNGMFALGAWWRDERRLVLVRDRLGKKPLYYGAIPGGVAFASTLPALFCHSAIDRTIDPRVAASYLRTGHVPEPHSIVAGASKVPAGSYLVFAEGRDEPVEQRWWSLAAEARTAVANRDAGAPPPTFEDSAALIDDAVERRLTADVPLGAFLSGGIDSSLVVARMQALSAQPVKTFAIGYEEAAYDESREAAAVARHLGTEHHSFILSPQDVIDAIERTPQVYGEPFADPSSVPSTILAERARNYVTVALTGDGGDEVFAGYNRYAAMRGVIGRIDGLPSWIKAGLAGGLSALSPKQWDRLAHIVPARARPRSLGEKLHKLAPMLTLDATERYRQVTSQWRDPAAVARADEPDAFPDLAEGMAALDDTVEQLRFLDLMTYLPGDILTKVDRATMACGLEARAPLLDYRLVEASFRIPTERHMAGGRTKAILRDLLARDVPRELFERPKSGFGIPISDWLRTELREWAEDLLDPAKLRDAGLVHEPTVTAAWQSHLAGHTNEQYGLWTVLMLESWRRSWADHATAAVLAAE